MQVQNLNNCPLPAMFPARGHVIKRRQPLENFQRGSLKKSKVTHIPQQTIIEIEKPEVQVQLAPTQVEERKYEIEFVPVPPKLTNFLPIMQKMAREMNCELLYNNDPRDKEIVIVSGHPVDIQILTQLLEAMKDCDALRKVPILILQQFNQRISELFVELNLIVHIGKTSFYVAGQRQNMAKLAIDLTVLEENLDRFFYPQYGSQWDFDLLEDISLISIAQNTPEFGQIFRMFHVSMDTRRFRIVNLQRIQNKHLVSDYVYHTRKAIELNPQNSKNRMLLFHGTRTTDPKAIYETNDVGFDLQYANNGKYGRGLYFAVYAKYCHFGSYSYRTPQNTYKLLIVDVYFGNSKFCQPGPYRKAPPGFDSIYTAENFYVLYHNSRSYPIYELEYEEGVF